MRNTTDIKDEMRQAGIAYERPYSDSMYWKNGNTKIMVFPTLDNPKTAKPFVVRIHSEHWLPINHIVFGSTEEEARRRILDAMQWCIEHEYKREAYLSSQAKGILEKYAADEMTLEVQELDIMGIYDVEWSSRGF